MRHLLSNIWVIHVCVAAGLVAIFGFVQTGNPIIAVCIGLSFSGAVCGAFVRVIDASKNNR